MKMLVNDFCYKRKFKIADLYKRANIFSQIKRLEFQTFKVFLDKYCQDPEWLALSAQELVIPIDSVQELEVLKKLNHKNLPHISLYIKDIKIILALSVEFGTCSLMVDSQKVPAIKDLLKSITDQEVLTNLAQYFKSTYGIYRDSITIDNYAEIQDIYTVPYLEFPFFSIADIKWDFNSLKALSLDNLRPVIWAMKFLRFNWFNSGAKDTRFNWSDLFPQETNYSVFKYELSGYPPYQTLYFTEKGITFEAGYPEIISYKDLKDLTPELLNKLSGIFNMKFPLDKNLFISYAQNFLVNENYGTLPYLNRIINNILEKGDI